MNSNRKLYFLSEGMTFVYFWVALSIPYLSYRGLTIAEALTLMSLYQFFGVVLEYPTGVFGDRYGYKLSMVISYLLMGVAIALLSLPGNYMWYLVCLFILSLGNSFESGNTQGLLKSITQNIRRDTANRTSIAELTLFLSAIVGTQIGALSYELALLISSGFILSATIPLILIKTKEVVGKRQPFLVIFKDSIKLLRNPTLRQIYLIIAIFTGFFFSIKSIFGSFGQLYNIDLSTIGWLIGFGALAKSISSFVYSRVTKISKPLAMTLLVLVMFSVAIPNALFNAISLLVYVLILSYIESHIDGDIHDLSTDHVRASLFSLKRLTTRLFSSVYLFFIGYAMHANRFSELMLIVGFIMILAIFFARNYIFTDHKANQEVRAVR